MLSRRPMFREATMPIDELDAVRELFADDGVPDDNSWRSVRSRMTLLAESPAGFDHDRRGLWRRSWRVRLVFVTVALAAATGLVVGLAVVAPSQPTSRSPGPTALVEPWPRSVSAVHPSSTQLVSSGGLEIAVPRSWRLNDENCGTPLGDTVLFEDSGEAVPLCLVKEPAGLTVVNFEPDAYLRQLAWSKAARHQVHLGSSSGVEGWVPATRSTPPLLVLTVAAVPTIIAIESPVAARAASLMATVRVVRADDNGCLSHVVSLEPSARAARPGAAAFLVPGSPTTASICSYSADWLGTSTRVSASSLPALISVMNALPEGSDQLDNAGSLRSRANCTREVEQFVVVRFSYVSGPPDVVYMHADGCSPASGPALIPNLSASNGLRSGRLDYAVISAVGYPFTVVEWPAPNPG